MRAMTWSHDFGRDVRYAARTLHRQPGFAAVATVTLALGIGANTAIFSVVNNVLLQPLPYRDSADLVRVWETVPGPEIGDGRGPARRYDAMDVADVTEMTARSRTVSQFASYRIIRTTATVNGAASRVEGFGVSGGFFDLLGVAALRGRVFTADEVRAGTERVIVLGYDAWKRYGGDDQLLGRTVTFGADPVGGAGAVMVAYTVIGVMPPSFRFPDAGAQFWIPRPTAPPGNGRSLRLSTIARLGGAATADGAAAEMEIIQRNRRGTPAAAGPQPRFELIPLYSEITSPVQPALIVLMSAVAVVLLIACVNVANLLLTRSESRQHEMAVRAAIGAGRGRLLRQMLAESLLLSGTGGIAGIGLAYLGVWLFRTLATSLGRWDLGLTSVFPRLSEVAIDSTALGYAVAVCIGTGVLFGLIPAFRAFRSERRNFLRDVTTSPRTGLKSVLVVAEIALAMALLVGGGLLLHSFAKLTAVDPGFNASNLLTFQVMSMGVQTPEQQRAFAETLVERVRAVPGVSATAYARQLPMVILGDSIALRHRRNGVERIIGDPIDVRFVSRDYLTTLRARLVAGRTFGETDTAGRPGVVVINETLARREFAGEDPIGQTVQYRQLPLEIIGVVGDIRQQGLDRAPKPQYFLDIRQVPIDAPPLFPLGPYYAVRMSGPAAPLVGHIRDVVRQLDGQAAVDNVAMMDTILESSVTRPRMYAVLLGVFAAVAVALAAIGLYGVLAYAVTQRTREIGIRMALGADRRRVLELVLRQTATLVALGLIAGLGGAVLATRWLTGLLFELTPLDPLSYVLAGVMFVAVASLAAYLPARRATAVDPMTALRTE